MLEQGGAADGGAMSGRVKVLLATGLLSFLTVCPFRADASSTRLYLSPDTAPGKALSLTPVDLVEQFIDTYSPPGFPVEHGHIEVYDKHGNHKGVLDPVTGDLVKKPVKGRWIEP
jgi:hypothetical protein